MKTLAKVTISIGLPEKVARQLDVYKKKGISKSDIMEFAFQTAFGELYENFDSVVKKKFPKARM